MTERALFIAQRLTAMLLAPLVLLHLGLILFATREGLSASAIHERMQASVVLPLLYGLFVVAAAIHAPIGLRSVLIEWTPLPRRLIEWAMVGFGALLLALGGRAILALWSVAPGGVS